MLSFSYTDYKLTGLATSSSSRACRPSEGAEVEERIGSNLKWGFNPRPHSNLTNDNPFSSCLARITGTTVALHCGKAHVQSQRKGANFDPHDIKIPYIFFSNLNATTVIMPPRSTPVQIFISIRSAESSPRQVNCYAFVTFPCLVNWLYCIFFGRASRSNP